jgi:hypothetical protein
VSDWAGIGCLKRIGLSEQINVGMDGTYEGNPKRELFRSRLVAYLSEYVLVCVE